MTPPADFSKHLPGISRSHLDQFCATAGMIDGQSSGATDTLSVVLTEIVREAHAVRMLPEHLLIGLRVAWRSMRLLHPLASESDTLWQHTVTLTLDCYERERPS